MYLFSSLPLFSLSFSTSPHRPHPGRLSLGTSLHPSSHMGRSTAVSLGSVSLSLHYASFSTSFSLAIPAPSPRPLLSLAIGTCTLSPLPAPQWLCVRSPSDCTHLSLSLSCFLIFSPLSHSLGSPAHLPKPLLAGCVPNLELHSLSTHVDHPRSKLHADCVVGVLFDWEWEGEKRQCRGSKDSLSSLASSACTKPFSLLG